MKKIIIVQCRLSSTRLPEKALYKLNGEPILSWCLRAMKKINADDYFVACDYDSEEKLNPVAAKNGFKIFAGSKNDVLDRFCSLIKKEKPDVVLRATADNPFLFFDAASELLDEYCTKYFGQYDYITYSGLPHGSGIEIFSASSLLKAETLTTLAYDHEHVGPSLYNHPESFNSLFLPAPEKYNHPELRTTIDTYADYLRASDIAESLIAKNIYPPFNSADVVNELNDIAIAKKILYIPCIKKGCGTGHLRRVTELALKTKGAVYIDDKKTETIDYRPLLKDFDPKKIVSGKILKNEYDLIVTDYFKMTEPEMKYFSSLGKTVFLDEGSDCKDYADYILDIIPSYKLSRKANYIEPHFIPGTENVRDENRAESSEKKVLICFGGEDPSGLTYDAAIACLNLDYEVTAVTKDSDKKMASIPKGIYRKFNLVSEIPDLKDSLAEYDLVITHYGFTAFECLYSNTPVILAATTPLHKKLSKKYGFTCLLKSEIKPSKIKSLLENTEKLKPVFNLASRDYLDLSDYILNLSSAAKYNCPVCRENDLNDTVVARTKHHTFRRCSKCKMIYISFSDDSEKVKYEKSYFAEEYKKQYGKTYLDDFESIKKSGIERIKNIDCVYSENRKEKTVLDIGCAYGPFLSAAKDDQWIPYGSDIAEDAVNYVNSNLNIKAVTASFADIDIQKSFGVEQFDAVTMWYVIEHIKDLDSTLCKINSMLKKGGVFAFSTPCGSGISRKYCAESFFNQSPKDHYSIWEKENTARVLRKYGFKVKKIVSTGIHPERLPLIKKFSIKPKSPFFKLAKIIIKLFKSGDTYEVYCKKISGIKNAD